MESLGKKTENRNELLTTKKITQIKRKLHELAQQNKINEQTKSTIESNLNEGRSTLFENGPKYSCDCLFFHTPKAYHADFVEILGGVKQIAAHIKIYPYLFYDLQNMDPQLKEEILQEIEKTTPIVGLVDRKKYLCYFLEFAEDRERKLNVLNTLIQTKKLEEYIYNVRDFYEIFHMLREQEKDIVKEKKSWVPDLVSLTLNRGGLPGVSWSRETDLGLTRLLLHEDEQQELIERLGGCPSLFDLTKPESGSSSIPILSSPPDLRKKETRKETDQHPHQTEEIKQTLSNLDLPERTEQIAKWGGIKYLASIIHDAEDFGNIALYLNATDRMALIAQLGGIQALCKLADNNAQNLTHMLYFLSGRQAKQLLTQLGEETLISMIQSAPHRARTLKDILFALYKHDRKPLVMHLKQHNLLEDIIDTAQDLAILVPAFNYDYNTNWKDLFGTETLIEFLSKKISTIQDLYAISQRLHITETIDLMNRLGDDFLQNNIQNAQDVKIALQLLGYRAEQNYKKQSKPTTQTHYRSKQKFKEASKKFVRQQQSKWIEDHLGDVQTLAKYCNTAKDLSNILCAIPYWNQHDTLIKELGGWKTIASKFKTPQDFKNIRGRIRLTERIELTKHLGGIKHFSGIIHSMGDLIDVLLFLCKEDRTTLFSQLQDIPCPNMHALYTFIQRADDLNETPWQERLPSYYGSPRNFFKDKVLQKPSVKYLLTNFKLLDLISLFRYLSFELLCDESKKRATLFINNLGQKRLQQLMQNPEQCAMIFSASKRSNPHEEKRYHMDIIARAGGSKNITANIRTIKQLQTLLVFLHKDLHPNFIQHLVDSKQLLDIEKTDDDRRYVWELLDNEQGTQLGLKEPSENFSFANNQKFLPPNCKRQNQPGAKNKEKNPEATKDGEAPKDNVGNNKKFG